MYRVKWVARPNTWQVGLGLADMPVELGEAGEQPMEPPQLVHVDTQLKRK